MITLKNPIWETRRTYLYNEGDECASLTGGWNITDFYSASTSGVTCTKNSNNMYMSTPSTQFYVWKKKGFATGGTLDVTNSSKLFIDCTITLNNPDYRLFILQFATNLSDSYNGIGLSYQVGNDYRLPINEGRQIVEFDLTSLPSTTNLYLTFYSCVGGGNGGSMTINAHSIWLE